MDKTKLKNTISVYLQKTGQMSSDHELNDYADSLISFFNLLIESDKKNNENKNLRNSNIAN